MRERTYFFITLTLIGLMIASCVALHFFCRDMYRRGQIISQNEREFNAVVGRHFEFDSIIVGTSMSENFKCSEFDEVTGGYSMKLTTSGGHISEIVFTADYALKYHKVNSILMDVIIGSYITPYSKQSIPYEMYEEKPGLLSQLKQALNITNLTNYSSVILNNHKFDRDRIYNWYEFNPCGKACFVRNIFAHFNIFNEAFEKMKNSPIYLLESNIKKHLVPWIKRHPDITFYIYLPPHSAIYFGKTASKILTFRKLIMDYLLPLPNVKLYDFQSVKDIVTNYDKYTDASHYSKDVNTWIIQQLKSDKYLVTTENRHIFEAAFADLINKFDLEKAMAELRDYYEKHCK